MFATFSNLKCAAFAVALFVPLSACDDFAFTPDDLDFIDSDPGEPLELGDGCLIETGAVNPDVLAWVHPWLALRYSEDCTVADLAQIQIKINGKKIKHHLLQMGSDQESNCAILIFRPYAGNGQPWSVEWEAGLNANGSDYVDNTMISDGWMPGWTAIYHEGAWTTAPANAAPPQCSVPLDWYLEPKPWVP